MHWRAVCFIPVNVFGVIDILWWCLLQLSGLQFVCQIESECCAHWRALFALYQLMYSRSWKCPVTLAIIPGAIVPGVVLREWVEMGHVHVSQTATRSSRGSHRWSMMRILKKVIDDEDTDEETEMAVPPACPGRDCERWHRPRWSKAQKDRHKYLHSVCSSKCEATHVTMDTWSPNSHRLAVSVLLQSV